MFSEDSKNKYYRIKNLSYKIRMRMRGMVDQTVTDDFLKNKRVIIIGPAESSMKYMSGSQIDDFDVVIRINFAPFSLEGKEQYLGTRTDFLFHCCTEDPIGGGGKIHPDILLQQQTKQIIYPYDEISLIANYYRIKLKYPQLNVVRLPGRYYAELNKNYKGRIPTTGLQTLNFLLHAGCSELHITGFSFFTTPYIKGYKPDAYLSAEKAIENALSYSTHDPEDELRLFKEIYSSMNTQKIFLDDELTRIIQ